MKKQIKLVVLFLAMVLCLSLVACSGAGKDYTKGLKFEQNEDKTAYTVVGYKGTDTNVVIPENYKGKPVTAIGDKAFFECESITGVTIPKTVTSIGANAFSGCDALESVVIPEGVVSIGAEAFSSCDALKSVDIPESVKSIGDGAFWFCTSLEEVIVPESITSIGKKLFSSCYSLKRVTLSEATATIGEEAFYYCTGLKTVYYGGDAEGWNDVDVKDGNGELTSFLCYYSETEPEEFGAYWHFDNEKPAVWNKIEYEKSGKTSTIVKAYVGGDFVIPTTAPDGSKVTAIGDKAFRDCINLTSVVIPEGIESIGEEAFYNCNGLVSVTFADSVKTIGKKAFYNCGSLKSVTIPAGVTKIDEKVFQKCGALTELNLHAKVKTIAKNAFTDCVALEKINFAGTKDQWSKVTKTAKWNDNTGKYVVRCTNGEVKK